MYHDFRIRQMCFFPIQVYIFYFRDRPFIAWRSIGRWGWNVEGQIARSTFTPRRRGYSSNLNIEQAWTPYAWYSLFALAKHGQEM